MKKVVGLMIGLMPAYVNAECVPVPDCASIGYTETSCDGDSIKCPFDTTKLYCPSCDSSFRYSCEGDNIESSIGRACNGKYVSCSCSSSDYVFVNGECICDTRCNVGAIYYSDGSCNRCLIEGKTPVGVVVKDNALIMAAELKDNITWCPSNMRKDMEGLTNYSTAAEAITDFGGGKNTKAIVDDFGIDVDVNSFAPVYCYKYAPDSLPETVNKWYLPAAGELNYVVKNYNILENTYINKLGLGSFYVSLWSSTEHKGSFVWYAAQAKNGISTGNTTNTPSYRAGCFMSIK